MLVKGVVIRINFAIYVLYGVSLHKNDQNGVTFSRMVASNYCPLLEKTVFTMTRNLQKRIETIKTNRKCHEFRFY